MLESRLTRRTFFKGAAAASLTLAAPYVICARARGAEDVGGQAPAAENAAKPLFNGKDLTDWDGDPQFWSVQDGAITGLTTEAAPAKGNTFIIWRGGVLKDFTLHVAFRLENHNSGIQYRSKDRGKWVVHGYQADMDQANTYTGGLYEEGGRGILATPGQKVTIGPDGRPKGPRTLTEPKIIRTVLKNQDWNECVIIAKGNHLTHQVNGLITADVTDDDEKGRALEGILAFQLHAGPPMKVQFKDITLIVPEAK